MNFKEQIQEDLNNIFFNIDEFGEKHYIDGIVKTVLVDNETLKERNQKEYDGIIQADLLYFIKSKDLVKKIKVGELQRFDGAVYTVFDVKYDSGIYEVILQGARN
ncbi:hypothetical protein JW813_09265 [Clostridium botulinum]|uniref:hypothetical protein n=1 Tax=Clostridium botulinum TaxID=1491 RepID=UPI002246E983|nr:hypothetical protein [Clostridium botulinum]UZP01928.1 hypothetical protein JW813_09265 [Clostridium botulinum]UZP05286.1 hypothetical protein JYA71_09535 [Clostridium botulinum]UZP08667.1 hypothetical protein JYA74_09260 [Clostridium botulinum]